MNGSPRQPYDLARTPLLPGTTLIEASAGTGKTFTLVGLFLRLLLDFDLSVRQILVVTFTDAATGELRARIRARLAEAAAALAGPELPRDPVLAGMLQPHWARRAEAIARLDRALVGFDEAPIFTIHGFCQRTLRDRAFESGALFDTELLKDDSRLLQEIADDFWRRHFYEAPPLPVQFLLNHQYEPENFLPLLRLGNRHPKLTILADVQDAGTPGPLDRLTRSFAEAQQIWQRQEGAIRAAYGESAEWAKGKHAKAGEVDPRWTELAGCFDDEARTPDSLGAIAYFATAALRKDTKAKRETPRHEFFEQCQTITELEREYRISLHIEFLEYASRELPRRKEALKVQSYDDLLTRLHAALQSPGGAALAREVRARYHAALIDEFQDTDPVQWDIFREIFATGSRQARDETVPPAIAETAPVSSPSCETEGPRLFLIGDPKQAIYGFRGADIFTYLDAAATVDQSHTLGCNFRSETALVEAVNTIFSAVDHPFLFDQIEFKPVQSAPAADAEPLTENGRRLPPMHLWFMPAEREGGEITKEKAKSVLPELVAAEMARLLNGETRLGERPLSPRDLAVLVPENRHARLMQEALLAWNIPSVLHTEESVFASREARELERVLAAMARPTEERLVRAALATELLGVGGAGLARLTEQETEWQQRLEGFLRGHTLWQEKGFTPMFRRWLQDEGIRQRLLPFADGERRLTNLLHLGEVLHQAALDHRLSPPGLVRWLSAQNSNEEKAAEEHQLRLERDDQAVKLVTVHKSKGMEYPIVFCPFSWKSSETAHRGIDPVFFHERAAAEPGGEVPATRFVCDLASKEVEAHREIAFAERLAENLRLLYVALTRARNRCYFVWGKFNRAGTSAPAWLFHPPPGRTGFPAGPSDPGAFPLQESLKDHFKSLNDATMLADLGHLARRATPAGVSPILIQTLPSASGGPYQPPGGKEAMLRPRVFTGRIARNWRVVSFSGLAAGRREETPDYDAAPEEESDLAEPIPEPGGIFAFPRGTNAGTCLHKIFEQLDFQERDDEALERLVRANLSGHGISTAEFTDTIVAMVRRTLAVPLSPDRPGFTLSAVAPGDRLNELEFQFPIERLTPAVFQSGFAAAGSAPEFLAQLARLEFEAVNGFVKGYLDLALRWDGRFYIVDWKSNWLGAQVEDYRPEMLARVMARQFYTLQYHLYTVALHRYLQMRLPGYNYERHFGGVRYLFLRGLDPARPEMGVFRDRPAAAWVEKLSASLAGGPS